MRAFAAVSIGRLIRFLVRIVRKGGGSALPGLVVSKIDPNLVTRALERLPLGVIVVTGSAGKSTTTKMLVALLRAHGISVFTNPSTANILQGYFGSVMVHGNLFGRLREQIAVIEADEAHAVTLTEMVRPRGVLVMNVVDDQLDRFVEPELVRETLANVAGQATEFTVLNGSDQNCLLIGQTLENSRQVYFSIEDHLRGISSIGMGYAATFLPQLPEPQAETYVSELYGQLVTIETKLGNVKFEQPNRGAHFAVDAAAAIAALFETIPTQANLSIISETLNSLPPVFARGEIREVRGQEIEFMLIQNPPSAQLNLDNLLETPLCVFVGIGRDVHDPSWLWTVNFSKLNKVDVVSGFNAAEIGLRLMIEGHTINYLDDRLEEAIEHFLALPTPPSQRKLFIFSADTMRRTRRYLGLNDPEDVRRIN